MSKLNRCFFLLCFSLANSLFAQSNYQELLEELKAAKDSKKRITLIEQVSDFLPLDSLDLTLTLLDEAIEISRQYQLDKKTAFFYLKKGQHLEKASSLKKAILYYDSLLFLANKNNWPTKAIQAHYHMGKVRILTGDFDEAKNDLDQALDLSNGSNDSPIIRERILYEIGNVKNLQGDHKEAVRLFNIALKSLNDSEKFTKGQLLRGLSDSYVPLGMHNKAIENLSEAVAIFQHLEDSMELSDSYNIMGNAYHNLGQLDKALDYYNQSLMIRKTNTDLAGMSSTYFNLGSIAFERGNYDVTMNYLDSVETIDKQINSKAQAELIAILRGEVYKNRIEYDKAELEFGRALQLAKQKATKNWELAALMRLSELNILDENYQEAVNYGEAAVSLGKKIRDRVNTFRALGILANAYSNNSNYEKAFNSLGASKLYLDSIKQDGSISEAAYLESRYNLLEDQQKKIEDLGHQKELSNLRNNWLLLTSFLLIALVVLIYFYLTKRTRTKVSQFTINQQLLMKDKQLLEYERELINERLSHEKASKADLESKLEIVNERLIQKELEYKKMEQDFDRMRKDKVLQLTKNNNGLPETLMRLSQSKEDWDTFMEYFRNIYHDFLDRLAAEFPDLTSNELRICALLKLNLSTKEAASTLNITPGSLKSLRYRIRKKLNLVKDDSLNDFLIRF